jgi:hypothetical protein
MKTRVRGIFMAVLLASIVLPIHAQRSYTYVSVSPTALQPMGGSFAGVAMTSLPFIVSDSSYYFTLTSSTFDDAMMFAPLNLPQGVALRTLTVYYTRNTNDGDAYMVFYLNRQALSSGTVTTLGTITAMTSASAARKVLSTTLNASYHVVDNSRYTYALTVGFSRPISALKFHGAKIGY